MKAIVYTKYGPPDVLHLEEVKKPALNEEKVLVKVHAASINASDLHLLKADPFPMRLIGNGFFKPKNTILGVDVAGFVEAIGRNVTQFKPGDAVFGDVFGLGSGSFAEYVSVPECALALKPSTVSFEEAAARSRAYSARAKSSDQRGVRRGGDVCSTDCQGGWSGSDCCVQLAEFGDGALDRRRPRN
jgi:NADPH:quinone reductase-like Zn-dependent oxidoreductase